MTEKTYWVKYSCMNCGESFLAEFKFEAKAPASAKCIHCGIDNSIKLT